MATAAAAAVQRAQDWLRRHPQIGVLVLTGQRFGSASLPTYAAAISFQTTLSLFPLVAVALAGASFFVEPAVLTDRVQELATFLAPGSDDLLRSTIASVTELRQGVGLVSLLALLWTGSNIFAALRRGLNVATGASRRRTFVHGRLVDLGIAGMTGVLLAISVGATAGLAVLQQVDVPAVSRALDSVIWLVRVVGVAVPVLVTTLMLTALYHLVPAERLGWRPALAGGLLGAIGFEAGKNAFVWYTATFGNFNVVYGPIATVVVLLLWLYYSSLIFLAGAAFGSAIAEVRRGRRRQSST